MDEMNNKVSFEDLDFPILNKLENHVFIMVSNKYNKPCVTYEEFAALMDEGLGAQLDSMIEEYYAFMGEVKADIPPEIYWEKLAKH